MVIFDPKLCQPVPADISVVPTHGETWTRKWANWWGGATIASPTVAMVAPADHALKTVLSLVDQVDQVDRLNAYYVEETEYAREWVRKVVMAPADTPVILDASGTAAILTATRIISYAAGDESKEFWTLTTDEGGSLVPGTLRGVDPNKLEKVMFQPASALFYEPEPVLTYPAGAKLSCRLVHLAQKTDAELVEEIRAAVSGSTTPGCIVLPHVSKTGRILPIREVGQMVAQLRAVGRKVYLVVDDIQGIGRVHPEATANPLSFCDAYVFGSSKALGGTLIASAALVKEEILETFLDRIQGGDPSGACFAHFQFTPSWESRLPKRLLKAGAVSLPEIVSMRSSLYHLYIRGGDGGYVERRQRQLAQMHKLRQAVIEGLSRLAGLIVLENAPDRPLVPSIICFRADKDRLSPAELKRRLQAWDPIITPSAPISSYLRLDIPEYRGMPSPDVLVNALSEILS